MTQFLQTSIQQIGLGSIVFVIWYLDRKQMQKRNEQLDEAQKSVASVATLISALNVTIDRNTTALISVLELLRRPSSVNNLTQNFPNQNQPTTGT